MAVTYSYDPPVGGATEIQVVFEYNNHYQSRSIESVFTDGEYDATATETTVAALAETILEEYSDPTAQ